MTVTHRFEHNEVHGSGDNKTTIKKNIVDGTEGLGMKYLNKSPKDFYMVRVQEKEPGKFVITVKKGDKEETMEEDLKGLMKFFKDNKQLAFGEEYLKTRSKELKGGSMKSYMKSKSGVSATKKTTKKSTKKSSKKPSKKTTKKSSKKSSKKAPKKSSKKSTKKTSKKSSKKTDDSTTAMKPSRKTMKKSSKKSKKTSK